MDQSAPGIAASPMLHLTLPIAEDAEVAIVGRANVSEYAFEDGRYVLTWSDPMSIKDSLTVIDIYHGKTM